MLKSLFSKKHNNLGSTYTQKDLEAIDNLTALLEENDPENVIYSLDLETILGDVDAIFWAPLPLKSLVDGLKNKSTLYPESISNSNAATILKLVTKDIQELKTTHRFKDNLIHNETKALQSLTQNQSITIKPL